MAGHILEVEAYDPQGMEGLLAGWQSDFPEMGVLALVAEGDRELIVPGLRALCNARGVTLRGAVFPGIISRGAFRNRGMLLIRCDVMPFTGIYRMKPSLHSFPEDLQRLVDDLVPRLAAPRATTLFMIFDQMVVDVATAIDSLYLQLADRVRYLGVNAGSESFRPMPCLFDNEGERQDALLAFLLPHHPGGIVEHCYQAPKHMISATSTEGSRIITIDWKPAFEVYQETIRAEYGISVDRESFYRYGVHFPFGIMRATGEVIVRIPVSLEEDGSLFCVGEVPPHSVLTLLRAPEPGSTATIERLEKELGKMYGSLRSSDLLTFYCAGRKLHLGDHAERELLQLEELLSPAMMAGALSLGEIGQALPSGYPFFHNGAIVCSRWGD